MKKVLLTGISGYIAMHCAKELLKRDYHINATVRNLDKVEDIKNALSALSLDVNKIQFFQADLLSDDNWEDAMAGCEYVMHVASPYPLNQPKDENVLIKPAVEGTERVVSLAIKNKVKTTKEKKGGIVSKENFIHISNLQNIEKNKKEEAKK